MEGTQAAIRVETPTSSGELELKRFPVGLQVSDLAFAFHQAIDCSGCEENGCAGRIEFRDAGKAFENNSDWSNTYSNVSGFSLPATVYIPTVLQSRE